MSGGQGQEVLVLAVTGRIGIIAQRKETGLEPVDLGSSYCFAMLLTSVTVQGPAINQRP